MSRFWTSFRRVPAIDDARWKALLVQYPFISSVGAPRLPHLREMCARFLASKRFAGEAGLTVDDSIGLAIAAQACLPVIELGLEWFDDFDQIIVYPDQFLVPRREIDELGVVHEETAWLAGETMDGGPIVLSWADIQAHSDDDPFNVVIHEFIHKLDLRDGVADGTPPLPPKRRALWQRVLHDSFDRFVGQLDAVEASIPRTVDPEGDEAHTWYKTLPLDAYAAEDPAEFFAVAGEAFFLTPHSLSKSFPDLFEQFEAFFRINPIQT